MSFRKSVLWNSFNIQPQHVFPFWKLDVWLTMPSWYLTLWELCVFLQWYLTLWELCVFLHPGHGHSRLIQQITALLPARERGGPREEGALWGGYRDRQYRGGGGGRRPLGVELGDEAVGRGRLGDGVVGRAVLQVAAAAHLLRHRHQGCNHSECQA